MTLHEREREREREREIKLKDVFWIKKLKTHHDPPQKVMTSA